MCREARVRQQAIGLMYFQISKRFVVYIEHDHPVKEQHTHKELPHTKSDTTKAFATFLQHGLSVNSSISQVLIHVQYIP